MKQDDGFERMAQKLYDGLYAEAYVVCDKESDVANIADALRQVSKESFNQGVESVAKEMCHNQGILHDMAKFIRSLKKEG